MKLSRYGFNVLVAVWLTPVLLLDFVGNTASTGSDSDFYYYKALMDGILMAMSMYFIFVAPTAKQVQAEGDDPDTVVGLASLAKIEYLYCALLSLYAFGSWWALHEVNKASTGMLSVASLVWSIVSIGVGVLSGFQFWKLKGKAIADKTAEMKLKMTQHDEE